MFDCGPTLVFLTQTHHPVLEHHTGYIFALFDHYYTEPRELFFAHVHEAQVFALHAKAELVMDPRGVPDRKGVQDYMQNIEDDGRFDSTSDCRPDDAAKRRARREEALALSAQEVESLEEDMVGMINFFGEDP